MRSLLEIVDRSAIGLDAAFTSASVVIPHCLKLVLIVGGVDLRCDEEMSRCSGGRRRCQGNQAGGMFQSTPSSSEESSPM